MIFKRPGKAIFTNPERVLIRKGEIFANLEGSYLRQSGRVLLLPIRKGPVLPIRKCPNFANPEESYFFNSGRVPFLPNRNGPNFAKPEWS